MSSTPGPSTPTKQGAQGQGGKKWLARAPAAYNKLPGTLFLTPDRLVWKQDGVPQPSVNVKLDKATAMFNSKEGALPVRLKIAFADNEKGYQFAFTNPDAAAALAQRTEFVTHLTPVINRNKSALSGSPAASGSATPGTPAERAGTPAASGGAGASAAQIGQENALRRSVLLKHPDLASLHRELVLTGQLSESEFWHGREWMLSAERAALSQRKGRASQLVDPKPQTAEGGDVRIVVTPQLVHDIFEEFPVVARAYAENVPNEMNEATFWSRYFQSELFNRNRASTRSSAPQHTVKPDPIFDAYLTLSDSSDLPPSPSQHPVDKLLDLGATEEDHEQGGNEPDVTMRPGGERGILPLIRRFNVHSERLLERSLGEGGGDGKRRKLEGGRFDPSEYYEEIIIDDLIDHHAQTGISLSTLNASLFSASSRLPSALSTPRTAEESRALLSAFKSQTHSYLSTLHSLKPARKPAEAAFQSMTQTVKAAHSAHRALPPIPPDFLRQMTTCQTAANEFLRQFWGAVLPPPPALHSEGGGGQRLGMGMSAKERALKVGKMAAFLGRTGEKVEALVEAAKGEGVDPERVRQAFAPLMSAVEKALKLYSQRRRKPAGAAA